MIKRAFICAVVTLQLTSCGALLKQQVHGKASADRIAAATPYPPYPQAQAVRIHQKTLSGADEDAQLLLTPTDLEITNADWISAPGVTSSLAGKLTVLLTVHVQLGEGALQLEAKNFAVVDDHGEALDGFTDIDLDAHRTTLRHEELSVDKPIDAFLSYTMQPGRRVAYLLFRPNRTDASPLPTLGPGRAVWAVPKDVGTSGAQKHFVGCLSDSRTKHTTVGIGPSGPVWGNNPACDQQASTSPKTTAGDVFVGCPRSEYALPRQGVYFSADGNLRLGDNAACPGPH